MTHALSLSALCRALAGHGAELVGEGDPVLLDVCEDSRDARPGALFVARAGSKQDGLGFVADALGNGAVAVLTDRPGARALAGGEGPHCPCLVVEDPALSLGAAAEAVHGHPSSALKLIGVTGTNGKTTTVSLVQQCLSALGGSVATIGTLGLQFGGKTDDTGMTTAQADVCSRFLGRVVAEGATHAAMEVSSHALAQHRVDALRFEVAAFSNLTQDHLDYHGTLEAYGAAKARLFLELEPKHAVLNVEDAFGAKLHKSCPGALSVGRKAGADVALVASRLGAQHTGLVVDTPSGRLEFTTRLVGAHNVDNWLLCIGILQALEQPLARLAEVAPRVHAAPGRMQRVELDGADVCVLVDYAHTPDALQRALEAARELLPAGRKLWCVFGCGGDRDRSKRPKMGRIAADLADEALVTSDNPRSEEPGAIVEQIASGMKSPRAKVTVELDRARAIAAAVRDAGSGDVVLIAGKGHEDYQLIGSQRLHFDDREVAAKALLERRGAGS